MGASQKRPESDNFPANAPSASSIPLLQTWATIASVSRPLRYIAAVKIMPLKIPANQ
jgi:hypothetical protein